MNKQILKLAIPNIISHISIPLLSSVDTALVGHLDQTYYLGAVAIGSMIFNFIYWGFAFLRAGTTGLTAQAYGKKNNRDAILILVRALIVALLISVILLLFQKIISNIAFSFVDASVEVKKHAQIYFSIRIWASPASLALFALHGWFLGMQNSRTPMIMVVTINAANIVFNIIFLKVFGMKADGVALGTVLANYLGLSLGIILFLKNYRYILKDIVRKNILHLKALKKFFSVNRDIFIRTLMLTFAYSFFIIKSAEFGDVTLAVNSILLNLLLILSYGVDGFAVAAESLVGKFVGAKDKVQLKQVVSYSFLWGLGFALILAVVYFLFDKQILQIFTNKQEVIQVALPLTFWLLIQAVINSFCFIWDGIYIGATATKAMLISMAIAVFVFYLPAYYLAVPYIGNHALWLAMTLYMGLRGVTLTLFAPKQILQAV